MPIFLAFRSSPFCTPNADFWEQSRADHFSDSSFHCEHLSIFGEQHLPFILVLSLLDRMSSMKKDVRGFAVSDISIQRLRKWRPLTIRELRCVWGCVSSCSREVWIYTSGGTGSSRLKWGGGATLLNEPFIAFTNNTNQFNNTVLMLEGKFHK